MVWAAVLGVLVWLALPAVDALGELLLLPPSYRVGVRILLAAIWLVGVAAVWAYRPSDAEDSRRRIGRED
jgi:hypothetical protein